MQSRGLEDPEPNQLRNRKDGTTHRNAEGITGTVAARQVVRITVEDWVIFGAVKVDAPKVEIKMEMVVQLTDEDVRYELSVDNEEDRPCVNHIGFDR